MADAYLRAPVRSDGNLATIEQHLVQKLSKAADRRRLGSAAVVLLKNGEIAAAHGFGGTSVDRTRYQVASVSKAVTAWGVMRLVQEGKLKLDEPVIAHLRRWKFPGSDARRNKVTVRHLLTHTSGLDDGLGYGFLPGQPVPRLEAALRDAIAREPGETFVYSGSGYAVLELLIEEVTNRTFADYMKEAVLLPLGMTGSSFDVNTLPPKDLATSYDAELRSAPRRRYAAKAPVALYATPADLARFARAFVKDNPALDRKTLDQMLKPQPATGAWGLGHTLFAPNRKGGYVVGHDGGTLPAWGAMVRVNPATGNGMVLVVSGGKGAVNQLGHDWVYWETGEHTAAGRRQRMYDRLRPASIAIALGAVAIVLMRSRRFTPWR